MELVRVTLITTLMPFRASSAWDACYIRDPYLDNKICVGNDVDFETDIFPDSSSLQCVAQCEESPSCKGVFHKRGATAKCYGCKTVYTAQVGLDAESDTHYLKPMAPNECATYGNTYQKYPRTYMAWASGNVDFQMSTVNDSGECLTAYSATTTFMCVSVNFYFFNNLCF